MADITESQAVPATLQAIRSRLDLTQEQLAERLGVSFTTVNRWPGGVTSPQRTARTAIDRKIGLHRRKRAVLEGLLKALLHKLMTREVRAGELGPMEVPVVE